MKTHLLLLITLALVLPSSPAWSQHERKLVIEPALPGSNDLITISVTDSKCYNHFQVVPPKSEDNRIQITLQYVTGPYGECLQSNPDAADFETAIGPLSPGEYRVALYINGGGLGSNLTDEKFFSVAEASPAASLSEGGINGLYYNPDTDGRYVYILETNYNTMVMWTTFDAEGNQLWIYGVGETLNDGGTVVVNTYINQSNGGVLPNGEVSVTDEHWGAMRVDMDSCLEGKLTYRSDLPEYGSGSFPIRRLAYSKQVGCEDPE